MHGHIILALISAMVAIVCVGVPRWIVARAAARKVDYDGTVALIRARRGDPEPSDRRTSVSGYSRPVLRDGRDDQRGQG